MKSWSYRVTDTKWRSVTLLSLFFLLVGVFDIVHPPVLMAQAKTANRHSFTKDSIFQHSGDKRIDYNRAALAFYYPWYSQSDWCSCHMSDLPTIQYNSSDTSTIDRQLHWATQAGLTGFISSWWGPGDQTDTNFQKLLERSEQLEQDSGYYFGSTVYFESDSPNLQGESTIINSLHYLINQYQEYRYFLRWHGKNVIFFWNPLGHGRTLKMWADIKRQVDPHNQIIWDAEGIDMRLLDVFDGIHLFSAGYWGLLDGNMLAVDEEFRDKVAAYNQAHGTHKIFAAGVMPGYDDTRVPGRRGTFAVPRHNGDTYRTSWSAAIQTNPDFITLTSFNEWFEGSMIEPSVTYNTLYLSITHDYAKQWHG